MKSFQYPVRVLNGKNRTFLPSWCDRFPWLDYSRCLDAAFCLPCLLFASSGQHLGQLYYLPFTNWLKAASEYSRHDGQKSHKTSMVQFSEFQSTASGQQADVATQLSSEHQRQADENMARLRSVISAVMFCGRQSIALRGHRNESRKGRDHYSKDANPGNFLAIMNFRAEACDEFATGSFHQSHGGKQVTYCGNRIQNDIIQCCGDEIHAQIGCEVNASPFFTVLADEACDCSCDCSNQEQMPIVVRFIDSKHVIREEFLGFTLCSEGTGGRALAELIIAKLSEWGLELSRLRGQGYDGAGNMAGRLSGCAAVIAEQYPNALFIHCSSHCLNLCVVAASKITSISNMWSTLLEISIFFKYSPKRQGKLESVIKDGDNNPTVTKLVDLCKTRWVARSTSLVTFEALYEYVRGNL